LLREESDGMGFYIVVLGDQRVDGARAFLKVFREVSLVGISWGLVPVALVLEYGYECVDDVVAIILGQSASVRGIVDVVTVDVAADDVVIDFEVGIGVVCGTNGGGDREGDDGGEEDELHVGLDVWFGGW
jgi:hypothetical protein